MSNEFRRIARAIRYGHDNDRSGRAFRRSGSGANLSGCRRDNGPTFKWRLRISMGKPRFQRSIRFSRSEWNAICEAAEQHERAASAPPPRTSAANVIKARRLRRTQVVVDFLVDGVGEVFGKRVGDGPEE